MSISTSLPKKTSEITRERVIKTNSIKRIIKHTTESINNSPLSFLLVFSYSITGAVTLFGRELDWKWYILLSVLTAMFILEKFNIAKPYN